MGRARAASASSSHACSAGAQDGRALDPEAVAAERGQLLLHGIARDTITRTATGPGQLRQRGVPEQLVQIAYLGCGGDPPGCFCTLLRALLDRQDTLRRWR
jgi:hypothetical protein